MKYVENSISEKTSFLIILAFTVAIFSPFLNADPLNPVHGEFSAVLQGFDPDTGEMILEGQRTGALPGHLAIRASISKQTGAALHTAARWTLITPWGETIQGENTGLLSTTSLHMRENGIIVDATGDLTKYIGNFVVIEAEVSDLNFIPGVTQISGDATYVPSQGNK